MSNYIKMAISANPGRALVTTAGALTASITTNSTDATVAGATGRAFTTSGGGIGATVALTVVSGIVTVATATVRGDGFKVGDTLTFDKSVIGGSTNVVITLVEDDLTAVDADAGSEQLIPIDDIISVESVLSAGSLVDNKLFISTKVASGDTTNTHSEFAGWTVTFSDLKYDEANCIASISEAIAKADSAVNSQPVVALFAGAEVEAIAYGKNPTTLS
jgi:hypothetical protein